LGEKNTEERRREKIEGEKREDIREKREKEVYFILP
jgi:hypothetical protein